MLRTLLIWSLCLCLTTASPLGVLGTAVNLDSLWGVWNDKSQPDTNRFKAINIIAWKVYMYSQPDTTIYLAKQIYQLAEMTENEKWMAKAFNTEGVAYKQKGDYTQALNYFNKSLDIYIKTGDRIGEAGGHNNLGIIYYRQGNYEKALKSYERGLNIFVEYDTKLGMVNSYTNIGLIYKQLDNFELAMKYYHKSIEIVEKIGDKKGMAMCYNNMGNLYSIQGKYKEALEYHSKSLELRIEDGHKSGMAFSYMNIGVIYKDQGNYEKALEHYQKSLMIDIETENKWGMASSYHIIGELFFIKEDFSKAIFFGEKALGYAREVGAVNETENTSKLLYLLYKKTDHPAKALKMYELSIMMKDSIKSLANRAAVIKYGYEKEQAVKEIMYQEEMKRQQIIAYAAGGALVLVLLFALFIYNRLRITHRQKKVIEEQKRDITDSIRYAENIQQALLPSSQELSLLSDSFVLYQPKDIVSGDFYWVQENNSSLYFAVCDCTGHGVPGAFMSMLGSAFLDDAVAEKSIIQPNEIFKEVREGFIDTLKQTEDIESQKDGMSAVICKWDYDKTLQYACAYNPLILIRDNQILETSIDKQPVGFQFGKQMPFTHHEIKLEKGDTIYLFSDGYPDQFGGPKDKKFMMKNFKKLLLSIQDKTMNEQKTILEETMAEWKGDTEQVDDILVMGVRF